MSRPAELDDPDRQQREIPPRVRAPEPRDDEVGLVTVLAAICGGWLVIAGCAWSIAHLLPY